MTFSLLHFLASHPRNADTLKKALQQNTDARRLLGCFGVTPTHLEAIDEGAIARRSAAVSVPRTVEVTAPASCADRLAEAEKTIKALRDRAESAEASVHELRQRLQAEIMAHDTTRSQVGKAPKPEQTPPEEVIVLGPWRTIDDQEVRFVLDGPLKDHGGVCFYPKVRQMAILNADGSMREAPAESREAVDAEACWRYALIDLEPGSLKGRLGPFQPITYGSLARGDGYIVSVKKGWLIRNGPDVEGIISTGPQTGEEGKRYALAAAHALGLTGGGE